MAPRRTAMTTGPKAAAAKRQARPASAAKAPSRRASARKVKTKPVIESEEEPDDTGSAEEEGTHATDDDRDEDAGSEDHQEDEDVDTNDSAGPVSFEASDDGDEEADVTPGNWTSSQLPATPQSPTTTRRGRTVTTPLTPSPSKLGQKRRMAVGDSESELPMIDEVATPSKRIRSAMKALVVDEHNPLYENEGPKEHPTDLDAAGDSGEASGNATLRTNNPAYLMPVGETWFSDSTGAGIFHAPPVIPGVCEVSSPAALNEAWGRDDDKYMRPTYVGLPPVPAVALDARYSPPNPLSYAKHLAIVGRRYDAKTHSWADGFINTSRTIGLTKIVSQCLHGNGRIFNPARVPARDFEFAPGKYHYMRHGPTLNKTARAVFVTFGGCAKSNIIVPADIAKQGQPATRTVRQIGINPYRTEWERTTAFCALVSRTTNITMPVFYRMLTIRTFSEAVDAKKGASTWEDDMPAAYRESLSPRRPSTSATGLYPRMAELQKVDSVLKTMAVPVYDAREYFSASGKDKDFSLPMFERCPRWKGEVPIGALVAVLHSISRYLSEGADGPWAISFNLYAIVIFATLPEGA